MNLDKTLSSYADSLGELKNNVTVSIDTVKGHIKWDIKGFRGQNQPQSALRHSQR